jgi:hypothetical protein
VQKANEKRKKKKEKRRKIGLTRFDQELGDFPRLSSAPATYDEIKVTAS